MPVAREEGNVTQKRGDLAEEGRGRVMVPRDDADRTDKTPSCQPRILCPVT